MGRVRFLLDEHVPHAVAEALRRRGVDMRTATESGLLGAPDDEYLERSLADGRVVVTHDNDFLRLDRERYPQGGIAYCEAGTRTIGQIVSSLLLVYEVLESEEMIGRVEPGSV